MLHGSPLRMHVLPLSPNNHPTTAQGSLGVSGGHPEIAIFHPTHKGLKTTKSSLVGTYRGADLGKIGDSTRDPVIGGGGKRRNKWHGTWVQTVAAIGQPNFDPPPPKNGNKVGGRGGGG